MYIAYTRPHLTHHTFSHHPPPKTPQKDRGYTRSSAVVSPKRDRLLTYLNLLGNTRLNLCIRHDSELYESEHVILAQRCLLHRGCSLCALRPNGRLACSFIQAPGPATTKVCQRRVRCCAIVNDGVLLPAGAAISRCSSREHPPAEANVCGD